MLNKSNPHNTYKANSGKIIKIILKCLMHLDPETRVFALAIDKRYNFVTNFLQ